MDQQILFIGLDVDDKNFHGYAMKDGDTDGSAFKTKASLTDLIKVIEKLKTDQTTVQICYESTYSGFHLCRGLQKAGFECSVIAAGLIPELASDRVKNDRLDAEKLCRFFSKGLLTAVHLPDEVDESNRMLIRSRGFLVEQLKDSKRHIISVCKQLGWSYRIETRQGSSYWTDNHREWLRRTCSLATPVVQKNFSFLLSYYDSLQARLAEYAEQISELAESDRYQKKAKALTAYRGISTVSAMTFVLEIGDAKRFPHPKKLISYAGLDIIEYSSGGKEKRFGLTYCNRRARGLTFKSRRQAQVYGSVG